jgi:hypothetical protein
LFFDCYRVNQHDSNQDSAAPTESSDCEHVQAKSRKTQVQSVSSIDSFPPSLKGWPRTKGAIVPWTWFANEARLLLVRTLLSLQNSSSSHSLHIAIIVRTNKIWQYVRVALERIDRESSVQESREVDQVLQVLSRDISQRKAIGFQFYFIFLTDQWVQQPAILLRTKAVSFS